MEIEGVGDPVEVFIAASEQGPMTHTLDVLCLMYGITLKMRRGLLDASNYRDMTDEMIRGCIQKW